MATPLEGTVSRDFSECILVLKTKSVLVEQASMLKKFKILLGFYVYLTSVILPLKEKILQIFYRFPESSCLRQLKMAFVKPHGNLCTPPPPPPVGFRKSIKHYIQRASIGKSVEILNLHAGNNKAFTFNCSTQMISECV